MIRPRIRWWACINPYTVQALALASLHPDHLTLSGTVLDQLAAAQSSADAAGAPNGTSENGKYPTVTPFRTSHSALYTGITVEKIDFLADGGDALKKALAADAEATRKLADSLKIFSDMELKTKELIRKQLSSL